MSEETNAPIDQSQLGNVNVAVFVNDGPHGPYHSIVIEKSYRDEQTELKRMRISLNAKEAAAALIALQREVNFVAKTRAQVPTKQVTTPA